MPVSNPRKTIVPDAIDCGGTATVTIGFDAAAAFAENPADIILLMDRSSSMTQDRLNYAKLAAKQLIQTVAAASGSTGTAIEGTSRMGLISFADLAQVDVALTNDLTALNSGIDSLTRGGYTNHKSAFEAAADMVDPQSANRQVVVMFTDGKTTVGGNADAAAEALKASGAEVFCIGLATDPLPLIQWASAPDSTHVAYTDDGAQLDLVFAQVAAEIVIAGALDAVLREQLHPDFKIMKVQTPTAGTVQVLDGQNLHWTLDAAGLTQVPETVSLTFEIMHIGSTDGDIAVNQSLTYEDRAGNTLTFPTLNVVCSGLVIFPEQCPVPTGFQIPGCRDAALADLSQTRLQSLGRIVQVDVTVRNVCPGKRVAVAVMLTEVGPSGEEYARGSKAFTLPALTGDACRDVTLRCIHFVVPEDLDTTGDPGTICNQRDFRARVMANYVDTDFVCCDADSVIL